MAESQYSADSAHHPHPTSSGRPAVCDDRPPAQAPAKAAVSPGICHIHGTKVRALLGTPARAPSMSLNPINRT